MMMLDCIQQLELLLFLGHPTKKVFKSLDNLQVNLMVKGVNYKNLDRFVVLSIPRIFFSLDEGPPLNTMHWHNVNDLAWEPRTSKVKVKPKKRNTFGRGKKDVKKERVRGVWERGWKGKRGKESKRERVSVWVRSVCMCVRERGIERHNLGWGRVL